MTKQPPLIKASMRSADLGHLADQIARLETGGVDALHFDVMDGRFGLKEIGMGPAFVRGLRKYTKLPFDVHLWLEEPDGCLDGYIDGGADCLVVHIETCANPAAALAYIGSRGCKAGLAINPDTPVAALEPLLNLCDEINVMTILPQKPGELSYDGVENLRQTARLVDSHKGKMVLQADGAVSHKTRDLLLGAGAMALIAGYPIFSRADYGEAISELRQGHLQTDKGK